MKTKAKTVLLAISGMALLAFAPGCVVEGPPPPGPAVVTVAPDYYVWDGYEYVGWVGDQYYYLGPGNVWLACDPVRVHRFNVWVGGHPDWRAHATVNVHYRANINRHPQPPRTVPARPAPHRDQNQGREQNHNRDHSHDRDRDHDHDHD